MHTLPHRLLIAVASLSGLVALTGCEGYDRKHELKTVDISPPPIGSDTDRGGPPEKYNFPDLVESMLANRHAYVDTLTRLEEAYLRSGDTVKANWARRQRHLTERVEAYPYLTATAPEQTVEAAPEQRIPEADQLYQQAVDKLNTVRGIPLAGVLHSRKDRAREALELFKRLLHNYPKSDKVDDAAFYCGEIYKEYLREDDPDDELALRYYRWAATLDPATPHAARFQAAVVYDFRRHDRTRSLELYHQVLETEEKNNLSNQRFAASRIEQLTDEEFSHLREQPHEPRSAEGEPIKGPEPVPPSARISEGGPESETGSRDRH